MGKTIVTANRVTLQEGDHAYNYYDRKSGTIQNDLDDQGWFTFRHWDGTKSLLDGERICTLEFAAAKGWIKRESLAQVVERVYND